MENEGRYDVVLLRCVWDAFVAGWDMRDRVDGFSCTAGASEVRLRGFLWRQKEGVEELEQKILDYSCLAHAGWVS